MAIALDPPAVAGGAPVRNEYLVFGAPRLEDADVDAVVAVLRSGWLGTGARTTAFEDAFKAYVGARHAIGVSSCTAALHVALVALGLRPGDEVVVPAMTFVATANAVIHAGATPVLCDVDARTQNLDAGHVERVLSPRTRAIVPVHFAGRAVDLTGLTALAERHGLAIVNDAAHAIETRHQNRGLPSFGAATAYSFYPTKNITTGEGGMIVTNDDALAMRMRTSRLHGLSADAWKRFSSSGFRHYEAVEPGFKYNMTDIQAALGTGQLARIETYARVRERAWRAYDEAFADLPVTRPAPVDSGDRHARHLYTVMLALERLRADRDTIAHALHLENIGVGVHYRGVHLQPYYRERFGYRPESCPSATWISERTLSLPMSGVLADGDIRDTVAAVTRVLRHYER